MGLFAKKNEEVTKTGNGKKTVTGKVVAQKDGKAEKKEPVKKTMKDLYQDAKPAAFVKTAKKGEKTAETAVGTGGRYDRAYRVLVKPLVTEKAGNLGAENKYVFAVELYANKIEIAKAITSVYGIKPASVNVIRQIGKSVRYGRIRGSRKDWKKAIITLPAGKSINIYEGV